MSISGISTSQWEDGPWKNSIAPSTTGNNDGNGNQIIKVLADSMRICGEWALKDE